MVYAAIAASLLLVGLLLAMMIRTNHWRNRRKAQRRVILDRRVNPGRRKRNALEHESSLPDRRKRPDRRVGPVTRRHKKRRAEDRLGNR
jgi:hypothetical protein